MTLHVPLWEQNDTYPAALDRQLIDVLFAAGGGVIASGDLTVAQRGAGANMSVDVAAGRVVVPGTDVSGQGKYLCWSDATTNVTISTAPGPGNSRIDLIIAQVRDADAIGGSNNDWIITKVTGTAASSPVAPSAPASSIVLAHVAVGASVSSIVSANVTDERLIASAQVNLLRTLYPVGIVVTLTVSTNPNTLFGFGTWAAFAAGQTVVGVGTSDQSFTAGSTGGESNHTLTSAESGLVNHVHAEAGGGWFLSSNNTGTGYTGADGTVGANWANPLTGGTTPAGAAQSHNNLPPYVVAYKWTRTA